MSQKPVFTKMVLPVVKVILTLLGFVYEVEFGEFSKGAEAKHRKSAR